MSPGGSFDGGPPPGMEGMEDMAGHMHDAAAEMPPPEGGDAHDHGLEPGAEPGGEPGGPPPDADDMDM